MERAVDEVVAVAARVGWKGRDCVDERL